MTTGQVIVAGSGASGLVAALAAAAGGADVLVLERSELLGGTTALGGGRVWVPANHCPENAGDSAEAARAYLSGLFPARYAHLTDAFLANAPAMARFVEERSPHRFAACPAYPDYHPERTGATAGGRCLDMELADLSAMAPQARQVRVPPGYLPMTQAEWEGWRFPCRFDWKLLRQREAAGLRANGVALAAALADGVLKAGGRIETGARLIEVTTGPDGTGSSTVNGAVVDRGASAEGGSTERVPAAAVILATGGFDWDEDLRRAWHPTAQRASFPGNTGFPGNTAASPGNTGDALRIARALGAATDNLGEGWWMPMMAVPGEEVDGRPYPRSLIRERAVPRQIMVNAAGRRFVDEEFTRRYSLPGFSSGAVPAWLPRAETPGALAALIGVDPEGLERTVARWNKACAEGADQDFGRGENVYDRYGGDPETWPAPNLGPLTEPPFYAARVLAGTIGTKGGPVTDATGTVLTEAGEQVRGLYAVGNAAAFWTGDAYPAPGATLGIGMTMGYIAGRHAAASLA